MGTIAAMNMIQEAGATTNAAVLELVQARIKFLEGIAAEQKFRKVIPIDGVIGLLDEEVRRGWGKPPLQQKQRWADFDDHGLEQVEPKDKAEEAGWRWRKQAGKSRSRRKAGSRT